MGRRTGWCGVAAAAVAAAATALVGALPQAAAAVEVSLGSLSNLAHNLAGDVYIINERVLEVRNFRYDGEGPAAYFWAGTGSSVNADGFIVSEVPGCGAGAIPGADGTQTVRLELPADRGASQIDYLSVWCVTFTQDFGSLVFGDRHAQFDALIEAAPPGGYTCFADSGGGGGGAAPAPVEEKDPVSVGALSNLAHNLAGDVYIINERVLEVRNFRYDGEGPAAYFWAGTGSSVNADGFIVSEVPGCGAGAIPGADGTQTVRLELPADRGVSQIDYLSVWCVTFTQDFGSLVFGDRHEQIDPQVAPAPTNGYTCFPNSGEGGGGGGGGGGTPPNALTNCVELNERLQVRWMIVNATAKFSLTARMTPNEWAGFGVSGSAESTQMVGSDVTVASVDADGKATVHDFHMSSQAPCSVSTGAGVCPDTQSLGGGGVDDVSAVDGGRDRDVATVRFSRPVAPSDLDPPGLDRTLSVTPGERTFISWALGPLDLNTGLPRFHDAKTDYPSGGRDVVLELGRPPVDECTTRLTPTAEAGGEAGDVMAWYRPPLVGVTEFNVVIGPSGGPHGYGAIHANHTPWGIAYYVNDLLVPVLAVERGKTYTFLTRTGDNPALSAQYHPVYITESDNGGFFGLSPAEQAEERTFAGVSRLENGTFVSSVPSPFCEYSVSNDTDREATFADYFSSLTFACDGGGDPPPGRLEWTVAADTPDLVYYQCTEHPSLGFRIAVFNEGSVDLTKVDALVADAPSFGGPTCELSFGGTTRTFTGCTDLSGRLRLFWTLNDADGTAEMALQSLEPVGYASVGWPDTPDVMVPGDAVVAYAIGDTPTVAGYRLTGRSSAGVQPDGGRLGLTDTAAEVAPDGTLSAVWTRPYAPSSGAPALSRGPVDFIWAVGSVPSSATSLEQHSFRASGVVDLAATNGGLVETSASLGAYYTVHAVLMGVSWLLLIPAAIIYARYFKGKADSAAWFQFHRAINTLSVAAVFAAWVMGLVRGNRSETAHLVLGCIVVPLAVVQVVAGVARPAKGASFRSVWYLAHSWSGRLAVVLGIVNVFFGMRTAQTDASTGWLAAVGAYVGVLVLVVAALEVLKWKSGRRGD